MSFSLLGAMVRSTSVSKYFIFRQRLVDNKNFLVSLAQAKTEKARGKILRLATNSQLNVLKDLILNIAEKNIEIGKEIYKKLLRKKKVKDLGKLVSRIKRSPEVSEKKLRLLLLKFNCSLPFIIQSILQ